MMLDIDDGFKLLKKAYEGRTHDLLMKRWILHHEKEMSFEDFKNILLNNVNSSNKTEEEILTDVKDIIETFNKKVVK